MPDSSALTRRTILAIGAGSLLPAAPLIFLTTAEASLLELICTQVVPTDQDPGAKETGAVSYIDRQLAGPLSPHQSAYRVSLSLFEPLRGMSFDEQTAFLRAVERKEHGEPAARLFSLVIDHTMQSFYGSPTHGGNRGAASWKMLGIIHQMDHS